MTKIRQSPLLPPVFMQQSTSASAPTATASPLPLRPAGSSSTVSTASKPHKKPCKSPRKIHFLLEIRDLSSTGSQEFLAAVNAGLCVEEAANDVIDLLYSDPCEAPGTRSVTLVLRSMDGVAYTTGKDFDDDHKEIHFSTDYIRGISAERKTDEILGVIRHEMVHCLQWNALGTAPGGLIEGIADWVRLVSGMSPPHWHKSADGDWDAGYQHTGYFLEYLESRFGKGSVPAINAALRDKKYDEDEFWKQLFGHNVIKLWHDYQKASK